MFYSIDNPLERFIALVLIVIICPAATIIALLIKCTSSGPVLYFGTRVGRHGKQFELWKFRTMRQACDGLGFKITVAADRRVTAVGKVLRKFKLDEIPQLVNIVLGEMSFVGPRPEDPRFISHYPSLYRELLMLRPGITGPASMIYRNEEELLDGTDPETIYITKILPEKLKIDYYYYFCNRSRFTDLLILLITPALFIPVLGPRLGTNLISLLKSNPSKQPKPDVL